MHHAPDDLNLRSLPQVDPPRDAWDDVRARLDRRERLSSRWLWLSTAALLIISLGTMTLMTTRIESQREELQEWMTYSRLLEAQIHALESSSTAYRGHEALAVSELEDLVALIDDRLATADSEEELALWRRRALVLNDLMAVHATAGDLRLASEEPTPVVTRTSPEGLTVY